MQIPSVLKNKYVGYVVMALAVINVLGYLSVKSYECLALFGLAGYSAHCYCKNQTCAILAGLFVANFLFGCGRVAENFEPMQDKLMEAANKMADAGNMDGADAVAAGASTCKQGDLSGCTEDNCNASVGGKWENGKCETMSE